MPDDNVTDAMIQWMKLEKKHLKRRLQNIFTLILSVHFLQSANVVIDILWEK